MVKLKMVNDLLYVLLEYFSITVTTLLSGNAFRKFDEFQNSLSKSNELSEKQIR